MNAQEYEAEARNYFKQVRKLKKLVENKKRMIEQYKREIEEYGGYHKVKYQESTNAILNSISRSSEKALLSLEDLEEHMTQDLIKLTSMQRQAFDLIGTIEDFEGQNILISRYLMYKEWKDICDDMDISEKWCLKLHARALKEFASKNMEFLSHWKEIFKL